MEFYEGRYHDYGMDLVVSDEKGIYVVCAQEENRQIRLSKEDGIIKDKKVSLWKNIFIIIAIFCATFMIASCIMKELFNITQYNYLILASIFNTIIAMGATLIIYTLKNKRILAKHAATHMVLNYIDKNDIPKTLDDVARALRKIENEDVAYDDCYISDFMSLASLFIFSSIICIFNIPFVFTLILLFVNYKIHKYLWENCFFNFIQSAILYVKPSKGDLILALSAVSFLHKDTPFSLDNNTDSSRDDKN